MTLAAELDKLKDDQRQLLKRIVRYGEELLALERRLLTQPPDGVSVKERLITALADDRAYAVQTLSEMLGVPPNTVQVTLKRNPKLFSRVGWGLYRLKRR